MIKALYAKLDARPDHKRILTGMVAVAGLAGLAKIVGAAKEVVVAAHYGTGPAVDAYTLLFNLLSWPAGVWASVAAAVLIPLLVKAEHADPDAGLRFRRELWGFTLCAGAGVGVVAVGALLIAPNLRPELFGGLGPSADQAALLALMVPLLMACGLLAAFLMADHRHANTLLEAAPAAAIVATLLVAGATGLWPLVFGTVAGLALQVVLMMVFQKPDRRVLAPTLGFRSPHWRVLAMSVGIVAAGQAVTSFTAVLDQAAAAGLGSGANAALGYATRLTSLVSSLGALAVARATLPVFSRLALEDRARQRRVARDMSGVLALLGLGAVLVGWVAAPLAVELLFQRGAFTADDARLVTQVFRLSLIQLPFFFSSMVLVQQIASNGDYTAFLKIGVVNLAAKLAALAVLVPLMGLPGVALSSAVMYGVGRIAIGRLAGKA